MELSSELGGWLLLYSGLDREGIAVAIASNVAGAASLCLEPDMQRAKQALRAGICDFLVNNLDEALRILKNEIRKRRPVSVVLTGDANAAVGEMVARGVQPDLLAFPVQELMERGARLLSAAAGGGLTPMAWSVASDALRWLPAVDALAVESLQEGAPLKSARVRWLEASPRYLGRAYAGKRAVKMTDAEAEAFVAALRTAVKTGAIPATVAVMRGGVEILVRAEKAD